MNTVTTRQTTRAPRKTVAEKRAEEQAARDKRDFWLVTVLYKSGHVNTLNVEANLLQSASFAV